MLTTIRIGSVANSGRDGRTSDGKVSSPETVHKRKPRRLQDGAPVGRQMSKSKNSQTIDDIQILRAFSVLIILFGHNYIRFVNESAANTMNRFISTWVGVDIFFAISGFVITTSFLRQNNRIVNFNRSEKIFAMLVFWVRRIFRIWPAAIFWAIAAVIVQLTFDVNTDPTFTRQLVASSWAAILQINNFHQANYITHYGHWTHGGIFWSLSTEEQFYMFFPILMCFVKRRFVAPLLLIVALIQAPFERNDLTNTYWYFFRTDAICYGVLAALFRVEILEKSATLKNFVDWAAAQWPVRYVAVPFILASILTLPTGLFEFRQYTALIAILSTFLVLIASANRDSILPIRFLRPALLWAGSRSFSIYLCQIPYLAFMYWCIRGPANPIGAHASIKFVIAVGVFLVAELSFRYIEAPFLRKGHEIIKKWNNSKSTAQTFERQEIRTVESPASTA
jgi:peptidoglycan/LPS O-acetylase OafA/YrhL